MITQLYAAVTPFCVMFAIQFANYLNLVVNFRAIAHKKYRWAVGTDALASVFTFMVISKVAHDGTYPALAGMVLGGALSSLVGIYITEHWGGGEGRDLERENTQLSELLSAAVEDYNNELKRRRQLEKQLEDL